MFSLLESKEEIAKAQRKLETAFRREFTKNVTKNIGYPGGTKFDARVRTDGHYWFWSEDYDGTGQLNPRRLNWFGIFRENASLQISVEVNIPYEGRNNRIAGFFARDNDTGAIYLLHSGRVGGGKKGVGKSAFLAWSDQRLIKVIDSSGNARDGVLVMPIKGTAAPRSALRYIDSIARFKQAVRDGETKTPEFKRKQKQYANFYSESRGRRRGRRSGEIDYLSRHGDVVDALHDWRRSRGLPKAGRLVKNVLIDMGVMSGRKLVEVFEIKTSTGRSDIYSAIGQLMVHGSSNDCKRVIVLPDNEGIADDLTKALQRINIQLLRFKLDKTKAVIV